MVFAGTPVTLKCVVAGVTVIPVWAPVRAPTAASVAVSDCVPGVFNAAVNVWAPLSAAVNVWLAASTARGSLLVRFTIPR